MLLYSVYQIHKYKRHDFLETDWRPAVEERHQQLLTNIEGDSRDLIAYKDRFMVVLQANRSKADLIGRLSLVLAGMCMDMQL